MTAGNAVATPVGGTVPATHRSAANPVSSEQIRAASDAYLAEGSATAAGRILGISRNTVLKRLRAGGVEVASRQTAIRERLAVTYDRGDGTMTVPRAAELVGLDAETVRRRCAAGRIPGARRDREGPRRLWRVPVTWVEAHRVVSTPRRTATPAADTYLPTAPLAEWIRGMGARGRTVDGLAHDAGMSDGSRLRTILRGEQDTIALTTADRLLTANDAHLRDVWPDLDRTDQRRTYS